MNNNKKEFEKHHTRRVKYTTCPIIINHILNTITFFNSLKMFSLYKTKYILLQLTIWSSILT